MSLRDNYKDSLPDNYFKTNMSYKELSANYELEKIESINSICKIMLNKILAIELLLKK